MLDTDKKETTFFSFWMVGSYLLKLPNRDQSYRRETGKAQDCNTKNQSLFILVCNKNYCSSVLDTLYKSTLIMKLCWLPPTSPTEAALELICKPTVISLPGSILSEFITNEFLS